MSTAFTRTTDPKHINGVSLLSLDAGGPRGISQLQILKCVMDSLSRNEGDIAQNIVKRPCEVFAAIGGTGTGGLISILLAVLEMTADEAFEEFTSLAIKVFKNADPDSEKQTEKLKQAIKDIIEKRGVDMAAKLIPLNGAPPMCRLIVPIMYKNNAGVVSVLSNYVDGQGPPTNLTISEAMLVTCATPPLFTPTQISKDSSTFEYTGADMGLSNPIREILAGAHRAFGDETVVSCLLSIGCGHPGINHTPSDSSKSSRIAFLERLAMDSERVAQDISSQMGKLTLYHRLSVPCGLETSHFISWKDPEEVVAHTVSYLNDQNVVDDMTHCVETLKDNFGLTTLEQLRHSGSVEVLPPEMLQLTASYIERKIPMEFIEKAVFQEDGDIRPGSKRVIVTGMGGCGKTQLVRKFVESHGDRFASVFVIDGTSKGSIRRDLVRYVRSLGGAHSQKTFEESMRFLSLPTQAGQRLLVIDNVDDPELPPTDFLPRWKDGTVILTSRNASHRQLGPSSHLQLDVMTMEESIELLSCGSGLLDTPREAARAIAEELGFLPIALVQATSYMFSTECSVEVYISRLRSSRERTLNDPAMSQVDMRYKTAFAAFDASYNILPSNAQKSLKLFSFFNRQMFPLECIELAAKDGFSVEIFHLLSKGDEFERGRDCLKDIFCPSPSDEWNPVGLDYIIRSLRNHSLVTIYAVSGMRLLSMHPLVHEWSRLLLIGDDARRFKDAAIRLLCGAKEENYLMMRYLCARNHSDALNLWKIAETILKARLGANHPDTVDISAWVASTFYQLGHYDDAKGLQEDVLKQMTRLRGGKHPDTVDASASLANMYRELGRYNDAKGLEEFVMKRRTWALGVDHPKTLSASAHLAATYCELGRYSDAKGLGEDVLKRRTRLLGVDHLDTVSASASLATTYRRIGQFDDAKGLEEDVLKQRTRLLGVDHPETISAAVNLAATYSELGRFRDAKELEEDILKRRTWALGVDHPKTLIASAKLAATYHELGRYSDAKELGEDVLKRRTRLLGIDHPSTVSASANLALMYRKLGHYEDAKGLQQEVLKQRKRLQGVDHPDTIVASINLAFTFRQMGRYDDSEKLQGDVIIQRTRLLGVDHPKTINASANLAATYYQRGRYNDAKEMQEDLLKRRMRLLGPDHPDTFSASASLAVTLRQMGRYNDAERLEDDVLKQSKRTLGVDHPDTIAASTNLAVTYHKLGRYDDTKRLLEDVLQRKTRLLGADHPNTVLASANLAAAYRELGRCDDAKEMEEEVLKQMTRLLGVDHSDRVGALANLAATYRELGRYEDAKELEEDVLKQRTKILGVGHSDTVRASANLATTYYSLGKFYEAEKLQTQALNDRTAAFGDHHPDTLRSMLSLARTYNALQRHSEALNLAQKASEISSEIIGRQHPLSQEISTFLASITLPPFGTNQPN